MRARVFVKQPDLLVEMFLMRMQGASEYALARKFETDKTTIRHWCDRTFDIKPVMGALPPVRQVAVISFTVKTPHKYQHLFDEEDNVNEGKNYLHYRVQGRKRQLVRQGVL